MPMPGRSLTLSVGDKHRFGFQGQETDQEFMGGAVSYKYRVHDARIGRFLSVDPLSPEYPFYSPYAFSGNRVIDSYELEGAEPWRAITSGIKISKRLYKIYKKTGKITPKNLKKAGMDELMDIADKLNTVFVDPSATPWDRGVAVAELVTGIDASDVVGGYKYVKKIAGKTGVTDKQVMGAIGESLQKKADDIHNATKNPIAKSEGTTAVGAVEDYTGNVTLRATREGKYGKLDSDQAKMAEGVGVTPMRKATNISPTIVKPNGLPSYHAEDGMIKTVYQSVLDKKVKVVTSSRPKGVCKECQKSAKTAGTEVAGRKQ